MKKQSKRLLILVLAFLLALCLGGCRKSAPAGTEPSGNSGTQAEETLDRSGTYDQKDDVALYLHLYGELPENYMTKKEARKLGWNGGSLEDYAEGMCIGGDYYGNYEGNLPSEDEYRECDIDTLGKKKRGAKRIVFSDDGDIYYTADHYEHFTQLYDKDGAL